MATSGIRRKVDDLGRVVIPAGVRRALNIREGDAVEVTVEGERVVLTRPRDACVFCGREDDDLTVYRSRRLCRECLAALGALDERARAAGDGVAPTAPGAGAAEAVATAATTPAPRPRSAPSGRRGAPRRRQVEPDRSGPIDGDALTRAAARDPEPDDEDDAHARRRPPHDPASTTAW